MGLSASPVAQTVIPALLAAIIGLVGGAVGIKAVDGAPRMAVSPIPVALIIIGVGLGAPGGILVRTHRVLAPKGHVDARAMPGQEPSAAPKGREAGDPAGLALRLGDGDPLESELVLPERGMIRRNECIRVLAEDDAHILAGALGSKDRVVRGLAAVQPDAAKLRALLQVVCVPQYGRPNPE